MAIDSIIITHAEEKYAPPEESVLRVAVVGGSVFLDICTYDETNTELNLNNCSQISVKIKDLLSAVQLLDAAYQSEQTEKVEPSGPEGN